MGGRKRSAASKPAPKKRPTLAKVFKWCGPVKSSVGADTHRSVLCGHVDACSVDIDRKAGQASISCKVCKRKHQYGSKVSYLTEPIDVYSDWIDDIGEAKEEEQQGASHGSVPQRRRPASKEEDEDLLGAHVVV